MAAEAYAANGLPGEAAAERLVIAGYLQSAGRHAEAAATARAARRARRSAPSAPTCARGRWASRASRASRRGAFDEGVEIIRGGLALALEHELTAEAAEVYQRLGTAHEVAGDYGGAREALGTAIGLCETGGAERAASRSASAAWPTCCASSATGTRSSELCEELIAAGATPDDTLVADGILGAVHAVARPPATRPARCSTRCLETATRLDVVSMLCDSAAALAWLADAEGDHERAARALPAGARRAGRAARTTTTPSGACAGRRRGFARTGALADARACAEALSAIAASAGHPDALAALAARARRDRARRGRRRRGAQQLGRAAGAARRTSTSRSSARRSSCARARRSPRQASATTALERLAEAHRLAVPARGRAARRARSRPRVAALGALARGAARPPRRRRARARRASRGASSR